MAGSGNGADAGAGEPRSGRPAPAREMEVGEIVGIGADGHVRREDEGTWLTAEAAFATEYEVDAEEADRILRGEA